MARVYTNLVEQTSTSTGTGDFIVADTIPYRRTFAAALADADTVEAMLVAEDGSFEHGIYEWDEPTLALVRGGAQTVLDSSNAGAAVNFAAGTKKVYSGSGQATERLNIKHNLAAVVAPTAADDLTAGYAAGSLWHRSSDRYYCYAPSAGAALWRVIPSHPVNTSPLALVDMSVNAGILDGRGNYTSYFHNGHSFGLKDVLVSGAFVDGAFGGMSAETSDATPKKMAFGGDWAANNGIYIESNSVCLVQGLLVAMDNADSTGYSAWTLQALVRGASDGTVTVLSGGLTLLDDGGTLNAAATSAALAPSGTGGYDLTVQVTGIAATNITWGLTGTLVQVGKY